MGINSNAIDFIQKKSLGQSIQFETLKMLNIGIIMNRSRGYIRIYLWTVYMHDCSPAFINVFRCPN